jgi:hypothetical protein
MTVPHTEWSRWNASSKKPRWRSTSLMLAFTGGFIVCLCAVAAFAQKEQAITIPTFFEKAQDYRDVPDFERKAYTTGLMDGFYGAAMFGPHGKGAQKLEACSKNMDIKQVTAIISKYVDDHPEGWNYPLSMQAYNALNNACPGGLRVGEAQ